MTIQHVPLIFDKARRAARSVRATQLGQRTHGATWLAQQMEQDTIERLQFMLHKPARSLVIGPATGELVHWLGDSGSKVTFQDQLDEEKPLTSTAFDLITSINRLDTVNDLPGALIHLRGALATDGLAIAHFLGAGSLTSLRQILLAADGDRPAARIHPQVDTRSATGLLQRAGFTRQVVDSHTLKVRFSNFDRLIADLREQALTGVLADQPPPISKSGLARARSAFDKLSDEDGKVTETFEILTMTGWR